MRFSFQLSRKWRERLRHWGQTTFDYVSYPWHMLVGAVNWCIALIARAWSTRHFRHLLQGFPALFAAAGLCVAAVFVANSRAQERRANLAKDYLAQAAEAWRKADGFTDEKDKAKRLEQLGVARTYFEKALSLEGGDRDDLKFFLAKVLEQMGGPENTEHCLAIMYKLAPDDANGYPEAHLWRGTYLVTRFEHVPEVIKAVERHYSRAFEIAKNDPEDRIGRTAAFYLSNMYINLNRYPEAIALMEKLEEKMPMIRIPLGNAYTTVGRTSDAQKMYASAERYYGDKAKAKIDDKESRRYWAAALMAQQKYEEAIQVLQRGNTTTQDNQFILGISEAYQYWEEKLSKDPNASLSDRLALVQLGLQAWPSNMKLLGRLYQFTLKDTPQGVEAKKQIDKLLADGKEAPIVYFIMGSTEFDEGRWDKAREYWELSYAKDPTWPFVINNLAWLLAYDSKDPDPKRALELIEGVVARNPSVPTFLGSRGQILVKLKKYKEAIPDLLKGLAAQPNDIYLNESIAEAYEAIGERQRAEVQRKKVSELREKAAKQKLENVQPKLPKEMDLPKPSDPRKPATNDNIGGKPPSPPG